MRPRLIAVDDEFGNYVEQKRRQASMRPRLIAVDDADRRIFLVLDAAASMRPRLIAVDDSATAAASGRSSSCFNEATADRRG